MSSHYVVDTMPYAPFKEVNSPILKDFIDLDRQGWIYNLQVSGKTKMLGPLFKNRKEMPFKIIK